MIGFLFGSLFASMPAVGGLMGAGPVQGFIGATGMVAIAFGIVFFLIYTVGSSALGGNLGVSLYREDVF